MMRMVGRNAALVLLLASVSAWSWSALPSGNSRLQQQSAIRSTLFGSRRSYYQPESEPEEDNGSEVEKKRERPTMTEFDVKEPSLEPEKPKVVVLGASGRIGRLVIQQLMEMKEIDMTVVAFVRDLGKANWALFDQTLVPRYEKKKGPILKLVIGDLVPPEELPGFRDREEERDFKRRAKSAASFYGDQKWKDYDNRDEFTPPANENLEAAISGATTIISCVGAVRPTNFITDYLMAPVFRLFRRNVNRWCKDPKHPYYVHYESTRKALELAESEQRKRNKGVAKKDQNGKDRESKPGEKTQSADRIRFIRISDLMVSQKPWYFTPILANMFQSMVFRYQDMTERLLQESSLVDTIILRPGDLTDEDRDTDITHLQVCESGKLSYPAVVGREDVAALAVEAALFKTENMTVAAGEEQKTPPPFHMTLATRWCGELDPPHAGMQGEKALGFLDAHACLRQVLTHDGTTATSRKRRKKQRTASASALQKFAQKITRRRLKPYGIFVAVPVYLMCGLLLSSLLPYVPGGTQTLQNVRIGSTSTVQSIAGVLWYYLQQLRHLPASLAFWNNPSKSYISI